MALIVLACLIFVFVAIFLLGKWILGPIDRVANEGRGPSRISIGDLMCLFIAVQVPLSFISTLQSEESETPFLVFTILTWVVAPIIWVVCALRLSRAGISGGKHRFLFMGLVLPVAYYGLIPFVLMGTVAACLILAGEGIELLDYSGMIVAWVCTGVALVVCGLYTNWLAKQFHGTAADANLADTLLGEAQLS